MKRRRSLSLAVIVMSVLSLSASSARAQMRVWVGDKIDYEQDVTAIDSITFAEEVPEYVTDAEVGSFAKGADVSWLTEMERDGVKFYNEAGEETECISLLRGIGMNAVRLRVWVNHSTGWCNKEDVVVKAIRAAEQGQRLLIDFHYSDFFCDPGTQTIPAAWTEYDYAEMKAAVREHTVDVLSALKQKGVKPEWVQVGNETRNGMLWDMGKLWDDNGDISGGWTRYAGLTTAGYEAVKSVFEDAVVVVHIDNAYENNNWFFRKLKQAGGKFDMIGLSHYMQTNSSKTYSEMNTLCASNLKLLASEFGCKVMIAEVGTKQNNLTTAATAMQDFIDKVCSLEQCAGVFYWEPQVYKYWKPKEYTALGWGAYDMGCFTTAGKPSEALKKLFK